MGVPKGVVFEWRTLACALPSPCSEWGTAAAVSSRAPAKEPWPISSLQELLLPAAKSDESDLKKAVDEMLRNLCRPRSQKDFRERLSDTQSDYDS